MRSTPRAIPARRRAIAYAGFGLLGAFATRRASAAQPPRSADSSHGDGNSRSGIRVEVLDWQEAEKEASPNASRDARSKRPDPAGKPR